MGKKPMKAEYNQRIHEVKCLLIQGFVRKDILKYGQKWDLCENSIDQMIMVANEALETLYEKDFESNRTKVLDALWRCYHEANATKDRVGALKVIGEFTGLHQIVIKEEAERIEDPVDSLEETAQENRVH